MDKNKEERIEKLIEEESAVKNEKDVNEVIEKSDKIINKSEKLDKNVLSKLFNQIQLTVEMLRDYKTKAYREIPWRTISLITVALLYFLNPFDIIPDLLPVLGFTDDAIAFASIFKSVQSDLVKYAKWKGYEDEKYF